MIDANNFADSPLGNMYCPINTVQRYKDDISLFTLCPLCRIFVNFVFKKTVFKHKGHKDFHKVLKDKMSVLRRSAV